MRAQSLTIKRVPIDQYSPAKYNPRKQFKPGDPEYEKLKRSIDEFGYVDPVIVNKRTSNIVGGHFRWQILKDRGGTHIDVSVVDLSPTKEKALNIALNKIQGEFDEAKLAALLDELGRASDLDLQLTGFDIPEAQDLIGRFVETGATASALDSFDEAAELAAAKGPPVTKPGDVIELGRDPKLRHRLICGDCTDAAIVRQLMHGQRATLIATDPPYLVDYDGTNHPGAKPPHKLKPGSKSTKNKNWSASYGVTWDDADANSDLYDKFIGTALAEAVAPFAAWYVWHASKRQAMLEAALNKSGIAAHCQIIWTKNRPVLTRTWYSWQHEPCLMGWLKPPKGKKPRRVDKSVLSTVWAFDTIPSGPDRPDHPTPKPLPLFEIPIRQHTLPGEVVYEPFAGSGTQIMAAQKLGRRCYASEVSPVYCDLIVRRFIAAFGEAAVDTQTARRFRRPESRKGAVA